jgi:plasmid replication initiation protein
MSRAEMATLQLQRYLERNTIKHPTALLHYERRLSDFEQGILFLCVHIVAKMERAPDGFYYLEKSLVRAVMRQEGNQDYTRITEAIKTISKTDLRFNFMGQDRTFDSYEAPLIIGRATNRKRGVIAFEVHPRIEKLVKDPRVFARLNIYFISALADVRRGYSFYALFRDLVDRTKTTEVTLDYRELRAYLGVEESAYPAFKAFKQWVLKPLIDAVNELTDLHLSYDPVKTGRKLTHLKFTIKAQAWQLQLFEAEHAERLVTELAKSFDGPVIENRAASAKAEIGINSERSSVIDKCVKLGVTSKTVERALKAYGLEGVGEIITHTENRFKKMDAKGDSYDAKNYLAKMLNDGVGIKAPAEREKTEKALKLLTEREAAQRAKTELQKAEEVFEAKFKDYQRERAGKLIEQQSAANVAELGVIVADQLPSVANYRRRWEEIGRQPAKLDRRKASDKTIFGAYVVPESLKLWGKPEDNDQELYRSKLLNY